MSADPEYRFTIDEQYLRIAGQRIRRSALQKFLLRMPLVLFAGLMAFLLWGAWHRRDEPLYSGMFLLVAAVGVWKFVRQLRRQGKDELARIPIEERNHHVVLGAEQLTHSLGPHRVTLRWSALVSAVSFDDGLLLQGTEQGGRWLPDSGLAVGSRADAEARIREHLPLRTAVD